MRYSRWIGGLLVVVGITGVSFRMHPEESGWRSVDLSVPAFMVSPAFASPQIGEPPPTAWITWTGANECSALTSPTNCSADGGNVWSCSAGGSTAHASSCSSHSGNYCSVQTGTVNNVGCSAQGTGSESGVCSAFGPGNPEHWPGCSTQAAHRFCSAVNDGECSAYNQQYCSSSGENGGHCSVDNERYSPGGTCTAGGPSLCSVKPGSSGTCSVKGVPYEGGMCMGPEPE